MRREPPYSQRFRSSFAGSDPDRFFHFGYKDFAITDFSGLRLFQNRLDGTLRPIIGDNDFEFNLWKKIHGVLGAAIDLAVSLLPAKSFYLAQSHSFDAGGHQGFLHRLSFKWLNNGLDFFHRGKLNPRAFEMASRLIRMPRRCNSFILDKLGKFSQKSASAGSDWGPMTAPRPVLDSLIQISRPLLV